jgi:hypothetical protein
MYYEIPSFGSVTSSQGEATTKISLQNLFNMHKISLTAKRFGRIVLILRIIEMVS